MKRTSIGGQGVLEGVMMRSPETTAIAVRREDGTISLRRQKFTSVRSKYKALRLPIIRGIIGFVESMILSFKTLSISAEQYGLDDSEPETKLDKWINDHFGEKLMSVVILISSVLGVAVALGLFIFLPSLITKWIE